MEREKGTHLSLEQHSGAPCTMHRIGGVKRMKTLYDMSASYLLHPYLPLCCSSVYYNLLPNLSSTFSFFLKQFLHLFQYLNQPQIFLYKRRNPVRTHGTAERTLKNRKAREPAVLEFLLDFWAFLC